MLKWPHAESQAQVSEAHSIEGSNAIDLIKGTGKGEGAARHVTQVRKDTSPATILV